MPFFGSHKMLVSLGHRFPTSAAFDWEQPSPCGVKLARASVHQGTTMLPLWTNSITVPTIGSMNGSSHIYNSTSSPGSGRHADSDGHVEDNWSGGDSNAGDNDGEPADETQDGSRKRKIRPLSVSCELVCSRLHLIFILLT